MKQGSDEWFAARCGVVTASNFKLVMTGGGGKTRRSYMQKLVEEILTSSPAAPAFQSEAMMRGVDLEPDARRAYEALTDNSVQEVGIAYLCPEKRVAASPDGLIGDDGGLEIKCPLPHTHEKYLQDGRIPKQYLPQVQGSLWVTGRQWWDFVSFAPEFGSERNIMVHRVRRDEAYIETLSAKIHTFIEELDIIVEKYKDKRFA